MRTGEVDFENEIKVSGLVKLFEHSLKKFNCFFVKTRKKILHSFCYGFFLKIDW